MSIESKKKWDKQVVSVPEGLKGLLSNSCMGCCVHEQHAKQHHMTRNSTRLSVVNLNSLFWANLCLFHIEKAVDRQQGHIYTLSVKKLLLDVVTSSMNS
jgi:hypothetical protein